jgi:LL-diaminopimelate aminotransferase
MRSKRLEQLPPYLFDEIDGLKESYIRSGREVLDLGLGDPDLGAPGELVESLKKAVEVVRYHRYPPGRGLARLVDAIRKWAEDSHGVRLAPDEVLVTIGSKEAIGHLPLAVVNPGDGVLVPDPGYPVYNASAVFAGARSVRFPLKEKNTYFPDFGAFDRGDLRKARLLFLNYPNNPTAAMAGEDHFKEAIGFCRRHGLILANDAAYIEIRYGKPAVPLFPAAKKAKAPFIEFFSFSKTFSITGWRIGFAVGSPEVISALAQVKANLDSGVFCAIQEALAEVMEGGMQRLTERITAVYRERRDMLAGSLARSGLEFSPPEATFYFWVKNPTHMNSIDFCRFLLEEMEIVATPGVGFGAQGEGYFRLSITTGDDTIREAGSRLETLQSRLRKS